MWTEVTIKEKQKESLRTLDKRAQKEYIEHTFSRLIFNL